MKSVLLLLLLASLVKAETVSTRCGRLRLGFDRRTGQWRELSLARSAENLLGAAGGMDIEMIAPDHPWPAPEEWQAGPLETGSSAASSFVRVVRRAGGWAVTATYRVEAGTALIQRQNTVRWEGTEPIQVVGAILRVPGVTLGGAEDACWCLPGNYPVEERPIPRSVPGRSTREQGWTWSDTGFAYARSEAQGLGLLAGYALAADHASAWVEEAEGGVSLVHRFETLALLQPGEEIEIGVQWVQVTERGWEGLQRAATALAERVNLGPPADRPAWLAGAVLEELHPWGRLEAWHGGDRGNRMDSLEAQLPYLHGLGVTGVWLLPVSNKPPWVYFLPRFRNLDEAVTTPEQLRSFIAKGHELGLHTLLDLVTYGISPDSPDVAGLPEHVWCVDEQGERQKAWGGSVLAADCSDPDWNAHVVDLGSYWVREFGCDGFRLDCGGSGQAPNWRPRSGPRANLAMVAGGIAQNGLLRRAIRDLNPDAILLPEAGATCHFRSGDLLFDYPFYMVCREITREPRTERWVAQTRQWLAAQQLTHSPRQQAALVRFLENHDTVAAQEFFGVGPSQALTALCAFLPGVLLLYQEEEIGFAPELRTWLRLRQELPELKRGEADYESVVASDPLVLAFLRFTETEASIVALNFGPADSTGPLDWPEPLAERLPVCQDAITGERIEKGRPVLIPAYRPRILTLRASSSDSPPDEGGTAGGVAVAKTRTGRLVLEQIQTQPDEKTTRHTIRLAPMAQWFVRTGEGFLQDEFVDRHRRTQAGEALAATMPPLARCWRPFRGGLWDGPGPASFGFLAADGRAVEFRIDDKQRVRHVQIDDPSALGRELEVAVEVEAGTQPFHLVEHEEGPAFLASLRREPFASTVGPVRVDPLWVTVSNGHYTATLSRRHGGTLFGLNPAGGEPSRLQASEVYTDWGLFEPGLHVASEWETHPRLEVTPTGGGAEITFRGWLRRPSWNGVQTGYVIEPPVAYRLTYAVDSSPAIRVTLGLSPTTDRPTTKAFFAYRLPFVGVESWEIRGLDPPLWGRPGEKPGQRVFQAGAGEVEMGRVEMVLKIRGGTVRLKSFEGHPILPQNPFLLDGGDVFHFFFALLDGGAVALRAHEEWTASFEVGVD